MNWHKQMRASVEAQTFCLRTAETQETQTCRLDQLSIGSIWQHEEKNLVQSAFLYLHSQGFLTRLVPQQRKVSLFFI